MSNNFTGYDLIGDLHGHAKELQVLLQKLGYQLHDPSDEDHDDQFPHPTYYYPDQSRQVIFVGDLIDRGPQIRETIEIVRAMVESGQALCILGNHEYNAIQFWNEPPTRSHSIKNILQHSATIQAFQNRETEWQSHLKWFKTLPLYLDLPGLRVVHATWNPLVYDLSVPGHYTPDKRYFAQTVNPETHSILPIYWHGHSRHAKPIIEETLKGHELDLPEGCTFSDKDGNLRTRARTKWWLNPVGLTYAEYLEPYAASCSPPGLEIEGPLPRSIGYPADEKPIFFGHYWLRGEPQLQAPNVCCLDYSVAKGGNLVAYRWSGEETLSAENFIYV